MTSQEFRATCTLSLVFALRMLGLFALLPVLSLYAEQLQGSTPTLIGLAIGGYGLSQALLQIPAGRLSDRIGRKPVIVGGLLLFMAGSLWAGGADTIEGVIGGRLLQGSGAIAAALTALLADMTGEENRTRAMAFFGMSIGITFCLSMVLGPLLASTWGLSALFYITAVLALLAIVLVLWGVPASPRPSAQKDSRPPSLASVLAHRQLLRLNFGVFVLHFILVSLFVQLPVTLQKSAGLAPTDHWWVYLCAMLVSFVAMVPFIVIGEKNRVIGPLMAAAIILLLLARWLVGLSASSLVVIVTGTTCFFVAFNYLEATLPSLVSRIADVHSRGTAMGLFSTCQFLGAGCGGAVAGYVAGKWGSSGVLCVVAVMAVTWWLLSVTIGRLPYVSSLTLTLDRAKGAGVAGLHEQLAAVVGVENVTLAANGSVAHLKIDKKRIDEQQLRQFGTWQGELH